MKYKKILLLLKMSHPVYSSNGVLLPDFSPPNVYHLSKEHHNAKEYLFRYRIVNEKQWQTMSFMPNTLIKDVRVVMSKYILYAYNRIIPAFQISVMDTNWNNTYPDNITIEEAFIINTKALAGCFGPNLFTIETATKEDILNRLNQI